MNVQWLAGFFDGEGTITAARYGDASVPPKPALRIVQKARWVLENIHEDYGGHLGINSMGISWLQLNANAAETLLRDIAPHLVLKRRQAELALLAFDAKGRGRAQVRHWLCREIKRLNHG